MQLRRHQTARPHTTANLLDAVLLVSGNDAANTPGHLGGFDTAVDKMNAKARRSRGRHARRDLPVRVRRAGSGWTTPHDGLASSSGRLWPIRCSRRITAQPVAMFPTETGEKPIVSRTLLVRYPVRSAARPVSPTPPVRLFVRAADRDGRRLEIAMMYGAGQGGRSELLGSGRLAAGLGIRAATVGGHRRALTDINSRRARG